MSVIKYEWQEASGYAQTAYFVKINAEGKITILGQLYRYNKSEAICGRMEKTEDMYTKFDSEESAINYVEGYCGKLKGKNIIVPNVPKSAIPPPQENRSDIFDKLQQEASKPPITEIPHTNSIYENPIFQYGVGIPLLIIEATPLWFVFGILVLAVWLKKK